MAKKVNYSKLIQKQSNPTKRMQRASVAKSAIKTNIARGGFNPHPAGTEDFFQWTEKNLPRAAKMLKKEARKSVGVSKRTYNKLPKRTGY